MTSATLNTSALGTQQHVWHGHVEAQAFQDYQAGCVVAADAETLHWLAHVVRVTVGERVTFTDGQGGKALTSVDKVSKKELLLSVQERVQCPPLHPEIHIVLGSPKPSTLEEIVSSLSEFGVNRLDVFTPDKPSSRQSLKLDKLDRLAKEALRVSKSAWSLKVQLWNNVLHYVQENPLKDQHIVSVLCDEVPLHNGEGFHSGLLPTLQRVAVDKKPDVIRIFIGPESSFSDHERQIIVNSAMAIPVSLGANILRVPTACLVSAGVAMGFLGRM